MDSAKFGRVFVCCSALLLLLATSGCGLLAADAPDLNIDLTEQLPASWVPVGDLQLVNLDGDVRDEFLLFFRYGGESGPIGAAIFDGQGPTVPPTASDDESGEAANDSADGGGNTTGDNVTDAQPNAELESNDPNLVLQMVGYRLLPRYWELERFEPLTVPTDDVSLVDPLADVLVENTLPQFIAAPDVPGVPEVTRISGSLPYVVEGGELLIRGGNTHLTSVWWDPVEQDYQVAQVYASGGLSKFQWSGANSDGAPIAVEGSVRLNDRSWLCRRYRFVRRVFYAPLPPEANVEIETDVQTEVNPNADEPDEALVEVQINAEAAATDGDRPVIAIQYDQRPLGLGFCGPVPTQPFYPEAVALAYFLDSAERDYLVDSGDNAMSPDTLAQLIQPWSSQTDQSDIIYTGRRVLDIRTRATLPGPNATTGGIANSGSTNSGATNGGQASAPLLPVVCIDFLDGFQRQSTDGEGNITGRELFVQRRQLLFTLTYRIPVEATVDDALRILSVREVPGDSPVRTPCELLVDQRLPESP